jgi:hypothetical protein
MHLVLIVKDDLVITTQGVSLPIASLSYRLLCLNGFRTIDHREGPNWVSRIALTSRNHGSAHHKTLAVLDLKELHKLVDIHVVGSLQALNVFDDHMFIQLETILNYLSVNCREKCLDHF